MTTPVKAEKTVLGGIEAPRSQFARRAPAKPLLSEESAREQVMELLDYYDIDPEQQAEDAKPGEIPAFDKALLQIQKYVQRGALEVSRDERGKIKVVQNLEDGKSALIYPEIGARHKIAMETFDPKAGYSRIYAFMGALSGVGKGGIEKLAPRDLGVVEVLGMVFLAA